MKLADQFVKDFPTNNVAYRSKGISAQYSSDYINARAAFEKALSLNNQGAESAFYLWTMTEGSATTKLANPLIKKALEINPDLGEA